MSKYQSYAKRLDEAFKAARSQYNEALDKVNAARKALSQVDVYGSTGIVPVDCAAKIARAKAELLEAEAAFDQVKRQAWPGFDEEAARLTRELEEAVKCDSVANPDAIDANGLELLKSGALTADDFAAMQQRYAENPTMLKLVGKHAADAAAALGDSPADMRSRAKLNQIALEARSGRSPVLRAWDDLRDCANRMSNGQRGRTDNGYTQVISARWEDACGASIEAF